MPLAPPQGWVKWEDRLPYHKDSSVLGCAHSRRLRPSGAERPAYHGPNEHTRHLRAIVIRMAAVQAHALAQLMQGCADLQIGHAPLCSLPARVPAQVLLLALHFFRKPGGGQLGGGEGARLSCL